MQKLIVLIIWASFYTLANNAVIDLYPLVASEFKIPKNLIGQVLGIYSISSFATLPLSMWLLKRLPDLLVYQIGLCMVVVGLVVVGFLPYIKTASVFLAVSFLFRMIQGSADIMLNMSTITMIQKAPNKDLHLNLLTGCLSIGGALGPLIVTLLEETLGFSGLYFSLAGLVLISVTACCIFNSYFSSPSSEKEKLLMQNQSHTLTTGDRNERVTLEVTQQQQIELSPGKILKITNVLLTLLFLMFFAPLWNYRDPILPLYLKDHGLKTTTITYFYLIQRFTNAIFGLAPLLFVKRAYPKTVILCGSIFIAGSQFLAGPSQLLGLQYSIVLILIGQAILGAAYNFGMAPLMSHLLKSVKEKYPLITNPEKLTFLYLGARAIGYWMGPFFGGFLYQMFEYPTTCDIFNLLFITMTCIFSNVFCMIPQAFGSCFREKKRAREDSYQRLTGENEANQEI